VPSVEAIKVQRLGSGQGFAVLFAIVQWSCQATDTHSWVHVRTQTFCHRGGAEEPNS
jgi:hypothetical protein